jgi:hypothetical protein
MVPVSAKMSFKKDNWIGVQLHHSGWRFGCG